LNQATERRQACNERGHKAGKSRLAAAAVTWQPAQSKARIAKFPKDKGI